MTGRRRERDGGGHAVARRPRASSRASAPTSRACAPSRSSPSCSPTPGVGLAEGGFAGVDVFFVISGFLITRVLVRELDRTGSISLARFFAGRIKRLMPQVLAVRSPPWSWPRRCCCPRRRADAVASDVMATGVYAMNWRLSESAVDYFAAGDADRPLDALLVAGGRGAVLHRVAAAAARGGVGLAPPRAGAARPGSAALLGARRGRLVRPRRPAHRGRPGAGVLLGGDARLGARGRRAARARAAERGLGARPARPPRWGGAGAIVVATLALDAGSAMPGAPALLPVLGAVALLAAGATRCASPAAADARCCTPGPARFVGRISYAWYVWHWPALVFAAARLRPALGGRGAGRHDRLAGARRSSRTAGSRSPCDARRMHLRRPRAILVAAIAGPAAAVAVGRRAVGGRRVDRRRCPRARPRAPASCARTGTIQRDGRRRCARARVDASRDRGKPYATAAWSVERRRARRRCVYGARAPGDDRRAVRRLARDAAVPRARARRAAPSLAAREPDQGGLPAIARVSVVSPLSRRAVPRVRRLARVRAAPDRAARSGPRSCWRPASPPTACSPARGASRATPTQRALADGWRPVLRRLRAAAGEVIVVTDTPRVPLDVPGLRVRAPAGAPPLRLRRAARRPPRPRR